MYSEVSARYEPVIGVLFFLSGNWLSFPMKTQRHSLISNSIEFKVGSHCTLPLTNAWSNTLEHTSPSLSLSLFLILSPLSNFLGFKTLLWFVGNRIAERLKPVYPIHTKSNCGQLPEESAQETVLQIALRQALACGVNKATDNVLIYPHQIEPLTIPFLKNALRILTVLLKLCDRNE